MTKFMIPGNICRILKKIQSSGEQACLVGGCVRDMVMGRTIHDWDITTSAGWEKIAGLFKKSAATGIKYGTVTVFYRGTKAEVTTFRRDMGYTDMRHPDAVRFTPELKEDLARRDFTMNAMAMDADGGITDPFGGMADIADRVIRCVGEPDRRFLEDALRMFRALRFSAQLGFEIEAVTKGAIVNNASNCKYLSAGRVRTELLKTICSDRPEVAADMFEMGLFGDFDGDTATLHKMAERLRKLPKSGNLRLISLSAAAGRTLNISPGEFLERLGCGREVKELSGAFDCVPCGSAEEIRLSCGEYGMKKTMAACAAGDTILGGSRYRLFKEFVRSDLPHSVRELAISGRELMALGLSPGREMGDVLNELYRHVCRFPEDNNTEKLTKLAEMCMCK